MLKENVRIGMVGCGAIAELYHLPALAANRRTSSSIVLADPNAQRLKLMSEKFKTNASVTDYRNLVGNVDGVIIATPPNLHFAMSKFFLEHGIPVLCEKPLSESIQEAKELIELSERTGISLAVNQTRRYFPTYQKIRELIASGELGELLSIVYHDGTDFNWPAASPHHFAPKAKGTWSDTGVHLLDSICYWLGTTPTLVESKNDAAGGPEAMATVFLEYQRCKVEIKVSRYDRLMNGFMIIGTKGQIQAEAEDWDEFTVHYNNGRSKRFRCASNRVKYNDFAKPMLQNFVDVIADGAQPLVSGKSVLGTTELLQQAYEQATTYSMPWNSHFKQWQSRHTADVKVVSQPMRVLVTGASGFLGGRLVEAMHLTELFQPVAAIRNWSRAARVAVYPVEVAICDILDPLQLQNAVSGVQAIVHCAYSDDRDSIVQGTKNLLQASVQHGIKDFVYISSAEVYGTGRSGDIDESTVVTATGNAYGDAKLEAELLCQKFGTDGLATTVLRPSLIYGPFGQSWTVDIARRLQSGQWGLFEGLGDGFANLVYVDDLIQAIFLCLEKRSPQYRVFNVNGAEIPTWNEYFHRLNHALGLSELRQISRTHSRFRTAMMDSVRFFTSRIKQRFEDQLMEIYLRGGPMGKLMKRLKHQLSTTPSGGELNHLYSRQARYIDTKIRQDLGYKAEYDLDKGIASAIPWMILHEYVDDPSKVRQHPQAKQSPRTLESAAT